MNRNHAAATVRPTASSAANEKQTPQPSAGANGEAASAGKSRQRSTMEDHASAMSRGELIFLLRDVHRYWSTPRISYQEIEQLEQQNLIQRSITGICAISLTDQGARVKNWQQPKAE